MDTSERPRRIFLRSGLVLAAAISSATAQVSGVQDPTERKMPDGRMQSDMILKAEYEQNLKDSHTLADLAKSIELDLEKNDQNVLSLDLLKKLDEVDKITKRIIGRVKK
jgi:hypothetical protein